MENIINWRFFRFAWGVWKKSLVEKWKEEGFWSLVAIVFSYISIGYFLGRNEMSTEVRVASAAFLGVVFTQILRFLWIALNAPFSILKTQDGIISSFEQVVNRQLVLKRLNELWTSGTVLRNRGEALMSPISVDPWWQEFVKWKNESRDTMALIDSNVADSWWTLGTYTPRRTFPQAFDVKHHKYLQNFDAWLERMREIINRFQEQENH